jgi:hypothetical protein
LNLGEEGAKPTKKNFTSYLQTMIPPAQRNNKPTKKPGVEGRRSEREEKEGEGEKGKEGKEVGGCGGGKEKG